MLLDSNVIIYSAQPAYAALRAFIMSNGPAVSPISYVEVLGYPQLTAADRIAFEQFFDAAVMLPLDRPVLDRAIDLRRKRRMSLGDSLIAATALVHSRVLVTHNVDDFRWISGLQLHDPLTI